MSTEYIQRHDGEWVDVTDGQLVACCDCGLVHAKDFAVLDDRILMRSFRDKTATAHRRRRNIVRGTIIALAKKLRRPK